MTRGFIVNESFPPAINHAARLKGRYAMVVITKSFVYPWATPYEAKQPVTATVGKPPELGHGAAL